MKKLVSSLIVLTLLFAGCASKAPQEKSETESSGPENLNPRNFSLYIPTHDEVSMHLNTMNYLCQIESGEETVSDDELKEILTYWVGNNDMTSMLIEAFLLNSENKILLNRMFNIIASSTNEQDGMTPFQVALSRRVFADPVTTTDSDGRESTRYVFMNSSYDENINLAYFNEYKPFDDEFGICIPWNNYGIYTINNESGKVENEKWFIYGGDTNSFVIHVKEVENVEPDKESMSKAMNFDYYKNKFPDTWVVYDLDKTNCLSNSGVDKYLFGYGVGPETSIPEIDCCTFVAFLYREKEKKLYVVDYSMNFSVINSNYEVRDRLYNLMGFYTVLAWCD